MSSTAAGFSSVVVGNLGCAGKIWQCILVVSQPASNREAQSPDQLMDNKNGMEMVSSSSLSPESSEPTPAISYGTNAMDTAQGVYPLPPKESLT